MLVDLVLFKNTLILKKHNHANIKISPEHSLQLSLDCDIIRGRADYKIQASNGTSFIIEVKPKSTFDKKQSERQLLSELASINKTNPKQIAFGALTDGSSWRFYGVKERQWGKTD